MFSALPFGPLAQSPMAAYRRGMCSVCGNPAAPGHWTEAGAASMADRFHARLRRGQVLRAVLSQYGLKAHDGGLASGIQLSSMSGGLATVRDLAEVWVEAERLTGQNIDPLDPRFSTRPHDPA